MNNILDKLFFDYVKKATKSESVRKLETEIENNKKWLKQDLSERQKKLLLRFEDKKDLIKELSNSESFAAGFKFGLKVGYEVNKDGETGDC